MARPTPDFEKSPIELIDMIIDRCEAARVRISDEASRRWHHRLMWWPHVNELLQEAIGAAVVLRNKERGL